MAGDVLSQEVLLIEWSIVSHYIDARVLAPCKQQSYVDRCLTSYSIEELAGRSVLFLKESV